jgi:hypothetical protein
MSPQQYADYLARQCKADTFHEVIISADKVYRYTLWRNWSDELFDKPKAGYVNWIMLNPSTADATNDDPTVRRCIGFTKALGFSELCVTNLFAYRATAPGDLLRVIDPIGILNDKYLVEIAHGAALKICAWGNLGDKRAREVLALFEAEQINNLTCLGLTKNGEPKHPLYLPTSATLKNYDRRPKTA